MSRTQMIPWLLIAAAFSIFVLLQPGPAAQGQGDSGARPASTGRFQVTAIATGDTPGYYIIDTETGELWHNFRGNKPTRVSGPLTPSK